VLEHHLNVWVLDDGSVSEFDFDIAFLQ